MKTRSGQSQESTGGGTASETGDPITGPVIAAEERIGKGDLVEARLEDSEIDEAAKELGLAKLGATTVKRLRDIGVAAEQAGAIRVALGRVLVCDDRLDQLLDVTMDVAKTSPDDDIKVKAATAGSSLANQISKNAELVFKMATHEMLDKPQEKRKFLGLTPEHIVVPIQNNVSVNLTEPEA